MPTQMTTTEVRKDMAQFTNRVVYQEPAIVVTRGRHDRWWAISHDKLRFLLGGYRFTTEYERGDDGRFYGSLREIEDIVADGDTLEELKRSLAQYLIEYADSFAREFQLYFNAPNRRNHYPWVMNVLAQESVEDVMSLID